MENKITYEEYEKARWIVERFRNEQKNTVQVSVVYNATLSVTIEVPADWSVDKIKEELKDGYYNFQKEDEENITLEEITELIVDGIVVM